MSAPGRLLYVMGPSGAGKDTLLAYARGRSDAGRVIFAHRYITRPAGAGGENHVALSEAEFAARRSAGLFALSWESHGLFYGIGSEIDLWRARGFDVVVSGARGAWEDARARYPEIDGVLIDAPLEIRAARLAARGREDAAAIAERLAREVPLAADGLHRIENAGTVEAGGEALLKVLRRGA